MVRGAGVAGVVVDLAVADVDVGVGIGGGGGGEDAVRFDAAEDVVVDGGVGDRTYSGISTSFNIKCSSFIFLVIYF